MKIPKTPSLESPSLGSPNSHSHRLTWSNAGPICANPRQPCPSLGLLPTLPQALEGLLGARAHLTVTPVLGSCVLVEGQAVAWEPNCDQAGLTLSRTQCPHLYNGEGQVWGILQGPPRSKDARPLG